MATDPLATATPRAPIALHRRVYLTGALVAAATAVVTLVALVAFAALHAQAASFTARDRARATLGAAQLDLGESQAAITLAFSDPLTASRLAGLPASFAQQQAGIKEWEQYQALARRRGWLPAGAARLSADLARLRSADGAPPTSGTGLGTPKGFTAAERSSTNALAQRVQLDFDAVRSSEEVWWSKNLPRHQRQIDADVEWLLISSALALLVILGTHGALARGARRRDVQLAQRDRDLGQVAAANEFEARLQRALELSTTEHRVFGVVEQALEEAAPQFSVEMLLADSSRAHFQQVATTGAATHSCSVESPTNCPAAQRGQVLVFESSRALDACPYLRDQAEPCSAVCVPVSVSGLTVGVVHAGGAHGDPPGPNQRAALELVSRRASDRIGMMRAFSRSETQASTDPLTGLPNRRFLEDAARRLTSAGTSYAVAFADLDHFKTVNDRFGHSAGDQALRVFARVLREGLRPHDLFCRYGGEEFVVVLPDCDEVDALRVLERIREQLAVTLLTAECPTFTASFGLAPYRPGLRFEAMVGAADSALLEAKRQGRNRVLVADHDVPTLAHVAIGSG